MSAEALRFAAAFFYSGIFWMMVWFVIENGGLRRPSRPRLLSCALVLMVFAAYLMLDAIVHQDLLAMPLDGWQ